MRQISLIAACIGMGLTLVCAAPAHADTTKKGTTAASQQTTKQPTRCPVSGKTLTDLKKAPKLTYQGKTYYFCCNNCRAKFQKNPQRYVKAAAEKRQAAASSKEAKAACCGSCKHEGQTTVAAKGNATKSCCGNCRCKEQKGTPQEGCCKKEQPSQVASTPSDALICPVSGEELDPKTAVQVVYNGKVYYVGCEGCKATFLKDPETYAKKAEQLSKQQGKPASSEAKETAAAPSDKLICPITEEELEIASAVRFTYNGKVYYTCCNSCKRKFLSDPETYAKKAEQLSKLQGQPEPASN